MSSTARALMVALVAIRSMTDDPDILRVISVALDDDLLPVGDVALPGAAEVRVRPLSGAERQRLYRKNKRRGVTLATVTRDAKGDESDGAGDVTGDASGDVTSDALSRGDKIPLSHDLSDKSEREKRAGVTTVTAGFATRDVTGDAVGDVTREVPLERRKAVTLEDAITPALRAAADVIGVQDVDLCWLTFRSSREGKTLNSVNAEWQGYCGRFAKNEAAERDKRRELEEKQRAKEQLEAAKANPATGPAAVAARRKTIEGQKDAEANRATPEQVAGYASDIDAFLRRPRGEPRALEDAGEVESAAAK